MSLETSAGPPRRLLRPLDTLEQRWSRLAPHAEIARPAGDGPFPVVVLFHGCGGKRAFLSRYVRTAMDAGVIAVAVDSFAPRGIGRARAIALVCTGLELPGWQRAGDVLAAVWGVSRMAKVDPARMVLAGWSHGSWAMMDLMTMPLTRPGEAGLADPDPGLLAPIRGQFLAYPYCGPGALSQLRPWRRAAEVFAIIGEKDAVALPAFTRRALRTAERAGSKIETWLASGATHAFDEDGAAVSRFRYDPDLAAEAERRLAAFLRRTLF
ncbi:MAG TPA: dienelactone hydrolase [Caulobacteraceae bacterium]|nr:dienelactone hydrolase [Caulobacteraceae bacterium]